MTSELTVTITLDTGDPRAVARFEESLRTWARQQPGVSALSVRDASGQSGGTNDSVWRAARRKAFGSPLPHPFSPLR